MILVGFFVFNFVLLDRGVKKVVANVFMSWCQVFQLKFSLILTILNKILKNDLEFYFMFIFVVKGGLRSQGIGLFYLIQNNYY